MHGRAVTLALFGLAAFGVSGAGAADNIPPRGCDGATLAAGRVTQIVDGRTLRLEDGREVRLAAIEVPSLDGGPAGSGPASRAALAALADGHSVVIKRLGEAEDRYGRLAGLAILQRRDGERLLQKELVAAGHARVSGRVGDRGCAAELLAAERSARARLLGLWSEPYYEIRRADEPGPLRAVRGRFMLVEGKVWSVRESGGTVYVNFGPRYTRDFVVAVSRRQVGAFAAAGVALPTLTGRRVRVRGVMEVRRGPSIYAAAPEQIEIVEPN